MPDDLTGAGRDSFAVQGYTLRGQGAAATIVTRGLVREPIK
jgi:hypothetical protein